SGLIIHVPEVYEDKLLAGGYNTPLTVVNGREYEVYYTERTADGDYPTFSTTLASEGKATGISGSTSKTENVGRDGDKWFQGTVYSHSECKNASDIDEFDFETKMIREHRLSKDNTYQFHVQGFDQFSLWGMDKKLDPKNGNQVFVVKIDGVEQPTDASLYNTTAYTVRRYNMTTGEHLIEISTTCTGSNVCYMGGFSLRVAQEPRTKWLKGNDSTQVVLQTTSPKNVFYYTKYNSMGETRLVWEGQEATGIALSTRTQDALGDTLVLGGTANCPVGEYRYNVIAYYNGVETSRVKGKFRVASDIQATSEIDIDAYQNEEMDQITFKYYALSADDVQLTWPNGQPQGISGNGNNGKYIIGGTPNVSGTLPQTFPFTITVAGADTIIQGKITIKALDYGQNAVLYLYKNNKAYVKDGVYKYLDDAGKYNLIARRAKEDGLRPAAQYANYKWVLISEDVDADNQEALALARGESDLPVLSMKSFSYTPGRLNWGEPNNGSLTMEEGRYITVQRADHPIFQALGKQRGDRIMVLDTVVGKGLMPVAVNFSGTLCLATARTRSIDDYYADGPEETFLHEVPSDMHGGRKYICLPIGLEGSNYLSSQGKKLIDETIKYLLGAQASITLPDLAITDFRIGNYVGRINDSENLILVPVLQSDSDLMKTAVPQITLASPLTHVTPAVSNEDGSVDFSNWHYGVRYTVSDYINTRSYDVLVQLYDPQGIDAVYTPGEWVNIYDMQGRKLTTTNEDIRQMALPTGVYIVVTENGTFKLTR
ncbi:MAG: T9SS type A sorting domain-containing protein, partial [Paludibacteraceae bacterium]|nr:T9SS type A sorting domain-containing protein [Paludibacteraceae bacterium]